MATDPSALVPGGYFEVGYYLTGESRGYKGGKWDRTKVLNPFDKGYTHFCVDVTEIETGNSTANQHMLAINQRLGFRPWQELNSWQGDAPELSARRRMLRSR